MPNASYIFNPSSGEIRRARRYVGSVRRAEDGVRFVGRISQHTAIASTAEAAFREVSALAMGFVSYAALRLTRSRQRSARARARHSTRATWDAVIGRRAAAAVAPVNEEALITRLQREAEETGETPLTADQIRASWLRGGVR